MQSQARLSLHVCHVCFVGTGDVCWRKFDNTRPSSVDGAKTRSISSQMDVSQKGLATQEQERFQMSRGTVLFSLVQQLLHEPLHFLFGTRQTETARPRKNAAASACRCRNWKSAESAEPEPSEPIAFRAFQAFSPRYAKVWPSHRQSRSECAPLSTRVPPRYDSLFQANLWCSPKNEKP